jgi:RNA polymerase sigma factor (sigma-70 family)
VNEEEAPVVSVQPQVGEITSAPESVLQPEQEALVAEHHEFARKVACKLVWTTSVPIEIDDAIGCALVGLVDAARRFDSGRIDEAAFMSFAYPRIRGEIIDHLRRNSLVTRTDLAGGERASVVSLDSLFEPADDGPAVTAPAELHAPEGSTDEYIDLRSALDSLTERERYVITAFAAGVTGSEVAGELGLSETRVWAITAVARAKLERDMAA